LSHHTRTVLQLLLAPVEVPIPSGELEVAAALEPFDHHVEQVPVGLNGYAASDLPTTTMGRSLQEDPLFFTAALAAGRLLAERVAGRGDPPQTLNLEP
jgi:hypothetical protein